MFIAYHIDCGVIPLLTHVIAVFILCCILSVEYPLHMQCYKVPKMQHLIVAEYIALVAQLLYSSALIVPALYRWSAAILPKK